MSNRKEFDDRCRALADCHEAESRLIGDLRLLLDQTSTALTRQAVLRILDRLLDSLPLHLELASQGGYLTEVHRLRPNWHRQVEALHGANVGCLSELHELRDHVRSESPSATIESEESGEIDIWVRSLESIRGHERQLLQGAFTLDIGGAA